MDNPVNTLQARGVQVRHVPRFTNSGVIQDTVVSFYVGDHGPFTLTYERQDPPAGTIRADIQARIRELRSLEGPIV